MNLAKYLIFALLIVMVGKRLQYAAETNQTTGLFQESPGLTAAIYQEPAIMAPTPEVTQNLVPFPLQPSSNDMQNGASMYDPSTISVFEQKVPTVKQVKEKPKLHAQQSEIAKYNRDTKTIKLKDKSRFVGVVEYKQAVTPPNIAIPAMQFITTMNAAKTTAVMPGSTTGKISLWGLKVIGKRIPVKKLKGNETIGYFWPESDIIQLNNGTTLVGILQRAQGNYKKHEFHALGPIWTQYGDQQLEKLEANYHVKPSATNVNSDGIGTIKQDGQTMIVYGLLLLQPATAPATKIVAKPLPLKQPKKSNLIQHKISPQPGLDEFTHALNSFNASNIASALAVYHISR